MSIHSVVFGAGRGVRLRPLTDLVAKPALPVLDVPLGAWSLGPLTAVASPVVVNVSHLASGLVGALEALGLLGWSTFLEEPEGFGTAGTLRALRDRAASRLVTWNGDVITDLDPQALIEAHDETGPAATVAIQMVERGADLEVEGGRVTRFIDRRREDSGGARFLGIAVFDRATLNELPDERPAGLGETLLRTLADRGNLGAHVHHGYWIDVGTPAAYLKASLDVLYGRAPEPPVPIPGDTFAVAGGRAYVGRGASVGSGSLGPGAIVLEGAKVAAGASVRDSILFPGAVLAAGETAEGSIWVGNSAM